MPLYPLYLESGPRYKKTMVHVLDLLGCTVSGSTTAEALQHTPDGIREFLQFLQRHGEDRDPKQEILTEVAEHITEGIWLGNGDPSIVFTPDLLPLSEQELESFIQRLQWMGAEMKALVSDLDEQFLHQKPARGRPIQAILEHLLESEYAYMAAFGRIDDLPAQGSIVQKRTGDLISWIEYVRSFEFERLRALTPEQRSRPFIHWKHTRTARKVLRRMLEHQWEHLLEIRERFTQIS